MELVVDNISLRMPDRLIVEELSLELRPGELVGLLGPNGAGKSTLLKCIVGILALSNGEIRLDGRNLQELSHRERALAIAYLAQDRVVEWDLHCRAVVSLGRFPHDGGLGLSAESQAIVQQVLGDVDAGHLADRVVSTLSGGEKARVLLARALAVKAPLMLVDEPISELDPYHQLHVMEILRAAARSGTGIIAVLHDLTMAARFMDRLVLMHEGALVAEGSPGEVLTEENLAQIYQVSGQEVIDGEDVYPVPWQRIDL